MKKDPFGVFEVVIPAKDGQPAIAHNSKIKVCELQIAAAPIADLADFYDHTLWRANRKNTSMDHICHSRPPCLPCLRCSILEPSCLRTICFQASKTEEAPLRTSLRSPRWNFFPRVESVYIQGVYIEHAAQNTPPGIQCHPADGYHGARLLRKFRLPDQQLLCCEQSIWFT